MTIYIINLPTDTQRRSFQTWQCRRLGLKPTFIDATSVSDIPPSVLKKRRYDWERPLRNVEIACYQSHYALWERITQNNHPALIIEDDALLSQYLPTLLPIVTQQPNIDYINLETVGRKKILRNTSLQLDTHHKLHPIVLDRFGAAGYMLFPSGASKLLRDHNRYGIALADAHIRRCSDLRSFQLEPAAVIQADQASKFRIASPFTHRSNISNQKKPNIPKSKSLSFATRRLISQLRQGMQHRCLISRRCTKRTIRVDVKAFDYLQEYSDATG